VESLALTPTSSASFWYGKRVLLTGHTGFKGSWLTIWLHRLGANVTGVSLPPETTPNLYTQAKIQELCDSRFCDIRHAVALASIIREVRPEIVLHLAAQPLVRASYRTPLLTFDTNVMGTANVLDALRSADTLRVAVMVTTDKVYRDDAQRRPYREDDPLGGYDPYSASKAASEIIIESYRQSFLTSQGIGVASARAGNVIGGGDWSEDRLIPDAVRAWQASQTLEVRRPQAVRPWQHVLEPLAGYLKLAQHLWNYPALAGSYNFGPSVEGALTVREIVELARAACGEGNVIYTNEDEGPHESDWLALEASKARDVLGVFSVLTTTQAVARTMAWYRAQIDGADGYKLCTSDISHFENLMSQTASSSP
jgi:CDP-glucose 4,6-dehydratase